MAWDITDRFPLWGETGELPPDGFLYKGGDQVNEKHLDALWHNIEEFENEVKDAFEQIDSDKDGIVDEADTLSQGGLPSDAATDIFTADGAFIGGDELEAGKSLTIKQDEYAVVGNSYTINGDAQIDGNLITVSNNRSHDDLSEIDPTDHLEVEKEYQITAVSGQNPAFDAELTNAFDEQLTAWDVTIQPTNGLSETYAFNFDTGRKWNNGSWDVPLTINWDQAPSTDMEFTVRVHRRA
jgi:hypothetical protein